MQGPLLNRTPITIKKPPIVSAFTAYNACSIGHVARASDDDASALETLIICFMHYIG